MAADSSRSSAAALGVNVVGYHAADSGLGQVARSISRSLQDAGVAVIDVDVAETLSPTTHGASRAEAGTAPNELHPVTIAVVTSAQLPAVAARYPQPFERSRLRIGYWFWELSVVPATHAPAFEFVDWIWAPSRFVADAYRSAGDTPVDVHPPYIPEPRPSGAGRAELGLDTRFTFLTSFDYLSVVERKNPTTVIMAFREAFPNRDDVALVVKSINAERKPASAREVHDAADGDPRIVLRDEQLDPGDHAALVAAADCFVSLHRSEGLGLHLAEAMWLGTPVIATAYSGNLDLMDDECAALVDSSLTPVVNGEGAYPEGELWAQPNIMQATEWMRRIAGDEALRERLADAARARIAARPGSAVVGADFRDAIEERLPESATAPVAGRVLSAVRGAASPLRNYINTHFEMTKREVRTQTHGLAQRQERALHDVGRELSDTVTSLAKVIADVHVHQTRTTVALRDELAELRDELSELRNDVNLLTEALVRLSESAPPPR